VDPFIQMPTNSQSLNPYSYIMNNPLSGTDPTGYMSVVDPSGCNGRQSCQMRQSKLGVLSKELHDTIGGTANEAFRVGGNGASKKQEPKGTVSIGKLEKPQPIKVLENPKELQWGVVPRSAWARYPIDLSNIDPETKAFDTITLHHSGNADTIEEVEAVHRGKEAPGKLLLRKAAATVRLAQTYNDADVDYHYLIDKSGVIYQARPLAYQGAHVRGNNPGNIGIAFLGDFSESEMSVQQMRAGVKIVRRLTSHYNLGSNGEDFIKTHGEFDDRKRDELKGAKTQMDYLESQARK
jgi:N-acetylmuramoyl-L-alanine amidase